MVRAYWWDPPTRRCALARGWRGGARLGGLLSGWGGRRAHRIRGTRGGHWARVRRLEARAAGDIGDYRERVRRAVGKTGDEHVRRTGAGCDRLDLGRSVIDTDRVARDRRVRIGRSRGPAHEGALVASLSA